MTPDLNQIRRDLGLIKDQQPEAVVRPQESSTPIQQPVQEEGITLSSIGFWLLAICVTGLLASLVIGPLIGLVMLIWEGLIAVAGAVMGLVKFVAFLAKILIWIVPLAGIAMICAASSS